MPALVYSRRLRPGNHQMIITRSQIHDLLRIDFNQQFPTRERSLSWSFAARYQPPLRGHPHKHCGNCLDFALAWRARMLTRVAHHHPGEVDDLPALGEVA